MSSTNRFRDALEDWLTEHAADLDAAEQDRRNTAEARAAVRQEGADALADLLARSLADHDEDPTPDTDTPMSSTELMDRIKEDNK